ncbi:DUF4082 domain-containing protein [Cryobacterium sp. MLB-32]|uniref:DUF4082 domain-containing protein n=1 Tax=Cryobacterium sp. MLB-32 TaxID=1529318 RepID=UPI003510A043
MYRAASGSLVFGAGTVQWSYGLDGFTTGKLPDRTMQQATVNVFADMDAQPATLLPGLVTASRTADVTRPTSTIKSGLQGQTLADGTRVTISGTATDAGGGVVAGVEISTDAGATWHPATGTTAWTYSWVAHGSPSTAVRTRAVDDSGNLEAPTAGADVNVACPCSLWGNGVTPIIPDSGDAGSVELGLKFSSTVAGTVSGVRFYKSTANTGTHSGSLWSSSGTRLATAVFSGESTSGWQSVAFSTPVTVAANTTYVVSYFAPKGHYAEAAGYLYPNPAPAPAGGESVDSPPLHAPRSTPSSGNGVYVYTATSAFPTKTYNGQNYWVDLVFNTGTVTATPPTVVSTAPGNAVTGVALTSSVAATFNQAVTASTVVFGLRNGAGSSLAGATSHDSATNTSTFTPTAALSPSTTYTATVSGATTTAGQTMSDYSWTFTTAAAVVAPTCPCSVFAASSVPATASAADTAAVGLGMKFRSDVVGKVTGIRFYKGAMNTGSHTGYLWSPTGTNLATVTFTGETASGWQQANLSTPVTIAANTTYTVSYYAPKGGYAANGGFFGSAADRAPLHGLASGTDGPNGVYRYGSTGFPTLSYNSSNYWVDVVFTAG